VYLEGCVPLSRRFAQNRDDGSCRELRARWSWAFTRRQSLWTTVEVLQTWNQVGAWLGEAVESLNNVEGKGREEMR
jgi:hypothetical protein